VNDMERALLDKAMNDFDSLTSKQHESLQSLLGSFGMYAVPRKANVRQLLIGTARHQLLDTPAPFIEQIKLGIPQAFRDVFWSVLTLSAVDYLFRQQLPTPEKVQAVVQAAEEHLDQFICRLDQDELGLFLHFVTGSSVMPDKISVTFNQLAGELRRPIAHTCSNTLELSSTYSSSQELKRESMAILNNTLCFQMNMV